MPTTTNNSAGRVSIINYSGNSKSLIRSLHNLTGICYTSPDGGTLNVELADVSKSTIDYAIETYADGFTLYVVVNGEDLVFTVNNEYSLIFTFADGTTHNYGSVTIPDSSFFMCDSVTFGSGEVLILHQGSEGKFTVANSKASRPALSSASHSSGYAYTVKGSGYSGSGAGTKFLREDGTWQSISGGGGSSDAVLYTPQSLSAEQQSQARTNIGAVGATTSGTTPDLTYINYAVLYTPQSLSAEQQTQARTNIGAVGATTSGTTPDLSYFNYAVLYSPQTLTSGQQTQARTNIGAVGATTSGTTPDLTYINYAVLYTPQSLSAEQQTQARTNIGAQDILVSGQNIKTVNNESLLGSGNITIEGEPAVNPFKGWFDNLTSLQTITPVVGDYAYVKGATTTDPVKIYECATNGTWSDSGRTVDTSNVQSFASGQAVNGVAIDDTQLANPLPNALVKAEDVMQLKAKLEGVTTEETKVTLDENTNWFAGYKVNELGKIVVAQGTSTSPANAIFITQVSGYSKVRALGIQTTNASTTVGYGFTESPIDPSAMTNLQLDVSNSFITSANISGQHEYLIDVPDGMNYLAFTILRYNNQVPIEQFYCYLQKGNSVIDIIPEIADDLTTDDSTKALSAKQGMLLRNELYLKLDIEDEQLILTTSNYLSGFYPNKNNYVWTKSSYTTQTGGWLVKIENQNTVMIEGHSSGTTFITFLKSIPDKSSLANGDPLDVCEGQLNRRNIVGKEIIPIPEDCRCIFVINTTVLNGNQAPTSMSIYSDKPLKDIVSEQQEEINENKSGIEAIFNSYTEIDLLQVGTHINTWYIGVSNENLNMWHYYWNSKVGCIYINVVPGQVYRVEKDSSVYAAFTFLKTIPDFSEHADHVNFTPDYAEGISGNIFVNPNNRPFVEIAAPSDAQYMCFVRQVSASGTTNGILPTRVALKSNVQRLNNIENRITALEDSEDSRPQDLFKIQANSIKAATTQETIGTGLTAVSYPNNPNRGTQITSMQIKNFIDKVDSMIFTWEPKYDIPAKKAHSGIYTYPKNTPISTGVPYSSNMTDNKHVGLDTSVYTFRTAIDNPYSVMYTECIKGNETGVWALKSAWGRRYKCSNGFAYYGTVCCSFSSSVLGSPIKWGNTVHDDYARDYGEFIPLAPKGVINWNAMQVGDVFDDDKHSYVVYDLARDSNGEVTAVTYAESSNGVGSYGGCRRKSYNPPSEFKFRDHESQGIYSSHYRYAKLCFNDKVRDKDTADYWNTRHTYNNAISTIYGDEPCLAQGELVVLNYNLYGTQEYTWTEIEVYKFQPTYYRLLTSQPNNWATDYGEYYVKENGEYRKLSTEDEPLDTMPDFSPNTYYERLSNPIEDWENIRTEQLSNMDTILNTFYSENNITPDPYNQDIDQHGHAFVLGYDLDPGLYKACMSDGTHRSGYVNWEILPNDFTITSKGNRVYDIENKTGKLMRYVLIGTQIEGDYRGFETSYGGRPISTYENNENKLTLYVSEMTNIVKPKIKFVLQGEYGLSTTNPIALPDIGYEED